MLYWGVFSVRTWHKQILSGSLDDRSCAGEIYTFKHYRHKVTLQCMNITSYYYYTWIFQYNRILQTVESSFARYIFVKTLITRKWCFSNFQIAECVVKGRSLKFDVGCKNEYRVDKNNLIRHFSRRHRKCWEHGCWMNYCEGILLQTH